MVKIGEPRVRDLIKILPFYRIKAKNVISMSRQLIAQHDGKIPRDRDALRALPSVGRKTANMVLNAAFGEPTIAVDTHIFRVCNRTGLALGKTPVDVELKLMEVVPKLYQLRTPYWLILHGRHVCVARRPLCKQCYIADLCKWQGKAVNTKASVDVQLPQIQSGLEDKLHGSPEQPQLAEIKTMSSLKVNQIKAKLRTMFESISICKMSRRRTRSAIKKFYPVVWQHCQFTLKLVALRRKLPKLFGMDRTTMASTVHTSTNQIRESYSFSQNGLAREWVNRKLRKSAYL
jgi:endonuclease III